jgi:hypothetical protein
MKDKIPFINTIVFVLTIFLFGLVVLVKDDTVINKQERRYMTTFEDVRDSIKVNSNGLSFDVSDTFETYLLDQFPMRNNFRRLKSVFNYDFLKKIENEDIFVKNGIAIKLQKGYNYNSIKNTVAKINKLRMGLGDNCYFILVPDKSSLFMDDMGILDGRLCDYERIETIIQDNLEYINYISVKDFLSLNDYYKTDSHWSQEYLIDVADEILKKMGNDGINREDYTLNEIGGFYGVYYSQAALNLKPDTIKYYTNDVINACTVYNYETNETSKIYNLSKLEDTKSMDNYDIFLSGSASLLRIDNPESTSDKTLLVFRDSYGSSLTPLLVGSYKTVYLIDLRYMSSSYLDQYIPDMKSNDVDVLFEYSTLLINIPNNFKIQ